MTWKNGRQLASASDGTTTVTYTYDQDGIRDSKTVGTTTYNYITQNGKVVRQTWNEGGTTKTFDIIYDANGQPYACSYDGNKYAYVLNQQGDVIRIVGYGGLMLCEYQYDAWGKVIDITGPYKDTVGVINPIRYRGYYYDTETGFYYLQSRYYDPSIGRFINADSYASTGQDFLGYNMFAYCNNNPVIASDTNGKWLNIVIGAAVGGIVSAVTTAVQTFQETGNVDIGKTIISGVVGATSGGIAATGFGMFTQAAMTAAVTFVGDVATQVLCEKQSLNNVNYLKAAHNAIVAGGVSILGSLAGGAVAPEYSEMGEALVSTGKDKLLTAYVKQNAGQSYSKLMRQANNLLQTGATYLNTGRGITSVAGTFLTWGVAQELTWS